MNIVSRDPIGNMCKLIHHKIIIGTRFAVGDGIDARNSGTIRDHMQMVTNTNNNQWLVG